MNNTKTFSIFHPNMKGTGCAIAMSLHPATEERLGFVELSMMHQKTVGSFVPNGKPTYATFDTENPITVSLGFEDLAKMLEVFRGETESIDDGHGIVHVHSHALTSFCIRLRHEIYAKHGYALEVTQFAKGNPEEDRSAEFFMTPTEALGISLAIEHSLGLVCFGVPFVGTKEV